MEFFYWLVVKILDFKLSKTAGYFILLKKKIVEFGYKNFVKIVILEILDTIREFTARDIMWIEARKRMFIPKLKHFCLSLLGSWYSISYIWQILKRRNWLAEDPSRPNDWRGDYLTMPQHNQLMLDSYADRMFYGEYFRVEHLYWMCLNMSIYIIMLNVFLFIAFFSRTMHEIFYKREWLVVVLMFSCCYLYTENWLLCDLGLAYAYHYGYGPFFFIAFGKLFNF